MAGTKYDIIIEQGACLDIPLTLTDDSNTAYDLRTDQVYLTGVIYRDYDQAVQATFTYSETDAANGAAKMSLNSADTQAMEPAYSSYDIFLIKSDGCVDRLLYGTATINGTAVPLP